MPTNLLNYLPTFMRKSKVYTEVFESDEKELQTIDADINDIENQFDINTATWVLTLYEAELGIETDTNKPLSERREVIKSEWRGRGKADAELLKVVADSYTNGDVVVSFNDAIIIEFTSQIGRPPNLNDVKNAIEATKPAHLRVEYVFRYFTVDEVEAMTITDLENEQLSSFAPF